MNASPQDIIVLFLNDYSNPGIDITTENERRDVNLAIFMSLQKTRTHLTATATELLVCTKRLPMPSHKGKRDVTTGTVKLSLPKVDVIEAIRMQTDPGTAPANKLVMRITWCVLPESQVVVHQGPEALLDRLG
eukprot:jgi/Tetstr1/454835/TSEL_041715.t1